MKTSDSRLVIEHKKRLIDFYFSTSLCVLYREKKSYEAATKNTQTEEKMKRKENEKK